MRILGANYPVRVWNDLRSSTRTTQPKPQPPQPTQPVPQTTADRFATFDAIAMGVGVCFAPAVATVASFIGLCVWIVGVAVAATGIKSAWMHFMDKKEGEAQ